MKLIYIVFGVIILLLYSLFSWFGWEFASAGRNSYFRSPFIYGGYRGGK